MKNRSLFLCFKIRGTKINTIAFSIRGICVSSSRTCANTLAFAEEGSRATATT